MKTRTSSAPRPVYRAKAQPADEGGHAVLRNGVVIFNDLHASLASAIAHDLNVALGSGRVYRCGHLSAAQECKILASDGAKVKTPRVYVGDAAEFVAELNRAAKSTAEVPRANPAKRGSRWFSPLPKVPQPRLTREDYRRLHEHAVDWIGAHDAPGDPMRLSVGMVYTVPDLAGGTDVDFRSDPMRRGIFYSFSADVLKRRAAAR